MAIPNHIFDQLNTQADLVAIIGKHTVLKKSGHEYKGCCPFHGEKTPSFYINPNKNMYHCFGCGVGGNPLTFLQEYENLTFVEAVQELSRQTGIDIPEDKDHKQKISYKKNSNNPVQISTPPLPQLPTPVSTPTTTDLGNSNPAVFDDPENGYFVDDSYQVDDGSYFAEMPHQTLATHSAIVQENSDGNLYELLQNIQDFYQQSLVNNSLAMQYFVSRGLTAEILQTFSLGYAPQGWQHLEQKFPHDIEGLKVLGLVRQSEKGRDYDLLRDRVIFPIRDNQGRTIGFAGRTLDDNVKPKYINSSDSPVFHKQHVLYGYYESRQHKANDWLVVEGYMDVIALYQAGIYGAVASMGTATNEAQISRLLNLNPVLTLSFDGDSAGQKAAWRTLEVSLPILTDDKQLQFLTLPDKHDPDTYIKENGVEAMRKQIQQATPLSEYVFHYLSEQYQDLNSPENKAKLMSQVRMLTSQLPKGSSFRSLLNNDIYQKLTRKDNNRFHQSQSLLNFNTGFTSSVNLCFCLLYQPEFLNQDPIHNLWVSSGVQDLVIADRIVQSLHDKNMQLPPLPTWHDLDDQMVSQMVHCIQSLRPHLPADPHTASHFILASLSHDTQQQLTPHWQAFYDNLIQKDIIDTSAFFQELLIQQLILAFQLQQKQFKNIHIRSVINQRKLTLEQWQKTSRKTLEL